MQLTRRTVGTALAAGLCLTWSAPARAEPFIDDQTAGALMQYFTDSDHVSVRSAIANYSLSLHKAMITTHWNNERVVIPGVAAPPGSQEAVDAITTASRPISGNAFSEFVKVRNEFDGLVRQGHVEAGFYYSGESDYVGQQVRGAVDRDFRGDQLNVSVGAAYGWDAIEPVTDDDTNTGASTKTTMHWNVVATEVVTSSTLVRVGAEMNQVHGLQHNPYRNVYAGGTNVPERHPEDRQRRDAFLKVNQYLPNRSSLKLHYRLYNDDWGVNSHEIGSRLSQYITHGIFASYEYRWYTQGAAYFYRDEYATTNGIDGYRSGDYRMAELASHLFGVSLDFDLQEMEVKVPVLDRMGLRCNYERYFNSNNYSANFLTTQITYRF